MHVICVDKIVFTQTKPNKFQDLSKLYRYQDCQLKRKKNSLWLYRPDKLYDIVLYRPN